MIRILANDGIDPIGIELLENAGFEVVTQKIKQEDLPKELNQFDAILVRSATKVRKDLIDASPNIKLIGRGGVGMDNIDVDYARSKGIKVVNTPNASSLSVAELVIAHMFTIARFLHDSNRSMPVDGYGKFEQLKKSYSEGIELRGKTLGIIGFGRIGRAVAQIALGVGMDVIAYDPFVAETDIELKIADQRISVTVKTISLENVLRQSDFISLHVPSGKLISKKEIEMMKTGVRIVNASRGGVVDETDLIAALNSKIISYAALDVFEKEPLPSLQLLEHPKISLSPHIGASTAEAQERVWSEMAEQVIEFFRK